MRFDRLLAAAKAVEETPEPRLFKTKVRLDRLRNVVRALREAPPELKSKFTMACYVHPCGTPACALGHFAARRDLQRSFRIAERLDGTYEALHQMHGWELLSGAPDYFNLPIEQVDDLFSVTGCDQAKTPLQAARYIERFIKRIEKEQSK